MDSCPCDTHYNPTRCRPACLNTMLPSTVVLKMISGQFPSVHPRLENIVFVLRSRFTLQALMQLVHYIQFEIVATQLLCTSCVVPARQHSCLHVLSVHVWIFSGFLELTGHLEVRLKLIGGSELPAGVKLRVDSLSSVSHSMPTALLQPSAAVSFPTFNCSTSSSSAVCSPASCHTLILSVYN